MRQVFVTSNTIGHIEGPDIEVNEGVEPLYPTGFSVQKNNIVWDEGHKVEPLYPAQVNFERQVKDKPEKFVQKVMPGTVSNPIRLSTDAVKEQLRQLLLEETAVQGMSYIDLNGVNENGTFTYTFQFGNQMMQTAVGTWTQSEGLVTIVNM